MNIRLSNKFITIINEVLYDTWIKRQGLAKKKVYLTATMADGYVKMIGPTSLAFTHYWRIVAQLQNCKPKVFWGHSKSEDEARGKKSAAVETAGQRSLTSHVFEIVELTVTMR